MKAAVLEAFRDMGGGKDEALRLDALIRAGLTRLGTAA